MGKTATYTHKTTRKEQSEPRKTEDGAPVKQDRIEEDHKGRMHVLTQESKIETVVTTNK